LSAHHHCLCVYQIKPLWQKEEENISLIMNL